MKDDGDHHTFILKWFFLLCRPCRANSVSDFLKAIYLALTKQRDSKKPGQLLEIAILPDPACNSVKAMTIYCDF